MVSQAEGLSCRDRPPSGLLLPRGPCQRPVEAGPAGPRPPRDARAPGLPAGSLGLGTCLLRSLLDRPSLPPFQRVPRP